MLTVKKRKLYSPNRLISAVRAVKTNASTVSEAARIYCVPRKTIDDNVKGKTNKPIGGKPGPSPMLTDEEEESFVNYLTYMSNQGFPLTRSISRTFVSAIIQKSQRPTLFSEYGPSDHWFRSFLSRHPELQERRPERQDRSRTRMSNETVMKQYFELLGSTLDNLGLKDKPGQIFNVDESGFSGKESAREKVTCQRGTHSYQQTVTTSDHVTATVCVSASGRVLPTMLIFSKSLPHRNYTDGVPPEWLYATSESGYVDSELFMDWFTKLFIPNCGRERPVLLIMDNHDCHLRLELLECAVENQIELLCLPPHTTHILQPLDVAIFGPLKAKFTSIATKLGFVNSHMVIGKARFPFVLNHSIDQVCSPFRVKESFRKTGIVPFSPDAIDKSQLVAPSFPAHSSQDQPSIPMEQPTPAVQSCESCGNFLTNPLVSSGLIPPYLSSILVPPKASVPSKRKSKMVKIARVVTGKEMIDGMKEKVENERKRKEDIIKRNVDREQKREQKECLRKAREEQRNARAERKKEMLREKERMKLERNEQMRKRRERKRVAAEQAALRRKERQRIASRRMREESGDESDHETVCKGCGLRDPLNEREIETAWTTCDRCNEWFHEGCIPTSDSLIVCGDCYSEE